MSDIGSWIKAPSFDSTFKIKLNQSIVSQLIFTLHLIYVRTLTGFVLHLLSITGKGECYLINSSQKRKDAYWFNFLIDSTGHNLFATIHWGQIQFLEIAKVVIFYKLAGFDSSNKFEMATSRHTHTCSDDLWLSWKHVPLIFYDLKDKSPQCVQHSFWNNQNNISCAMSYTVRK